MAVLVTRPADHAAPLSDRLRSLGAEPVEAPMIATLPAADRERLEQAVAAARAGAIDWVAFTSVNAVAGAADACTSGSARAAAVGPVTADALADRGIRPALVADPATSDGLAAALVAAGPPARILLPRADRATRSLPDALRAAGWDVVEVEAYRTAPATDFPPGVRERIADGGVGVVTFASASAARAFADLFGGPPPPPVRVATIGPATSGACRALGIRVDAEADPHDVAGLVEAVAVAAGYPRHV